VKPLKDLSDLIRTLEKVEEEEEKKQGWIQVNWDIFFAIELYHCGVWFIKRSWDWHHNSFTLFSTSSAIYQAAQHTHTYTHFLTKTGSKLKPTFNHQIQFQHCSGFLY